MISWQHVDPAKFERAVQMLLRKIFPDLRSLDGSGGDGGRDSQLVTSDGKTVFEMKSFADRLSGSQRRQIEKSLRSAVANAPGMNKWVLVIPLNMTPKRPRSKSSEEAWFDDKLSVFAPGVDLRWWGRDWLDGEFADRMDLQRYIEGADSQLLERAGEMHLEQSVLSGGAADLSARMSTLRQRVDEVSPHWTLDWETRDETQIQTLRAKHDHAHIEDPIVITPTFSFPDEHKDALAKRHELTRVLDFGGTVTLPAPFVDNITIDASPDAQRLIGFESRQEALRTFHIVGPEESLDPPRRTELSILAPDGSVRASTRLRFVRYTRGQVGVALHGEDFVRFLTVVMRVPVDAEHTGGEFTYSLASADGRRPMDVLETLETLASAEAGDLIEVDIPDLVKIHSPPLTEGQPLTRLRPAAELAWAIRRFEIHSGATLHIPGDLTEHEASVFIALAKALDDTETEADSSR